MKPSAPRYVLLVCTSCCMHVNRVRATTPTSLHRSPAPKERQTTAVDKPQAVQENNKAPDARPGKTAPRRESIPRPSRPCPANHAASLVSAHRQRGLNRAALRSLVCSLYAVSHNRLDETPFFLFAPVETRRAALRGRGVHEKDQRYQRCCFETL